MKSILRLLMTGLLAGVLLFCGFGFVATCEPMPTITRWIWRALYSIASLSTLAGLAFTWRRPRRKEVA